MASVKAAVLGGGSFGTAMANILADNGHQVTCWLRDKETIHNILNHHENRKYLPGIKLNPSIGATADLGEALADAELCLVAIPSKAFRQVIKKASGHLNESTILVTTTKGIEQSTFSLMSEILLAETPCKKVGVLSGPNLAKEIADRKFTGSVIASEDKDVRELVQKTLSCTYFRVYANKDRFGVELGGALKNIYAIAAGMAAAMELGENTKSMLITRSLAEMSRFASHMGGDPMTFLGLSGVGDLVVTCTSPLSRNFQVGHALAQGSELQYVLDHLGGTAEGVNTIKLVKEEAEKLGVYMPLVSGLYETIFNLQPPKEVIKQLMLSEQNSDVEFVLPSKEKLAELNGDA